MEHALKEITALIEKAAEKARRETSNEPEPNLTRSIHWPLDCTVGPGLEGAIACESKVGYVNGTKGWLVYRGYDIFDLCAYSSFEEVSYLLLHGHLPDQHELQDFDVRLKNYRTLNKSLRRLMGFPVEEMNAMAALRMGVTLMRQEFTYMDQEEGRPTTSDAISADEDSIPMETSPKGEEHAIYEFKQKKKARKRKDKLENSWGIEASYHLISGAATITAAIARIHQGKMPIEPDPDLGHAANFLYMMTGRKPT
ncbi:MAG: citrate/2-methylcitrate synthase, partial [Deltaproteobacteria bacterium]|nr:citrate/2-methylcitrate synthase [Deltaproteobacteria bacterium]